MTNEISVLAVSTVPETLFRFVAPLANTLRDSGVVFSAATSASDDSTWDLSEFESVHRVRWSRSPRDPRNFSQAARDIKSIIANGDFDLVHVHTPIASFVTRCAIRETIPTVYTAHGFHFYEGAPRSSSLAFRYLEKLAANWTSHLVVINEEDHQAAQRYGLAEKDAITKMGGVGVDLSEFPRRSTTTQRAAKQGLCEQLQIGEDEFIAMMIARIDTNKRQSDVLEAIAQLHTDFRPHLVLAGTGTDEDERECREYVRSLELEHRVHFLGYRSDVAELLAAADAFLLVSDREGLPRSIMEALAIGTPTIGTQIRGTIDLLQNDAGLLVPCRSPKAIAAALEEARSFEANAAAVEQILTACNLDTVASDHLSLYQRFCMADHRPERAIR